MTLRPLEQRTAIVTGAGSGIGEAIAVDLAALGASVVLAARTRPSLERVAARITDAGGTAHVAPTDVTDRAAVDQLVAATEERFSTLDILINNAGHAVFAPIADSDPDAWWSTVEVNLKGMYLCTRAALPHMTRQGSGHVVNILSVAATAVFPASSAYGSAKAAGLMFTRVLAQEVRAEGIRVTAVLPGATSTPFWLRMESGPDTSLMMEPKRVAETVSFVVTQKEGAVIDEILVMPPGGIL